MPDCGPTWRVCACVCLQVTAEGLAPVVAGCSGLVSLELARMPRVRSSDCAQLELSAPERLGLCISRGPQKQKQGR